MQPVDGYEDPGRGGPEGAGNGGPEGAGNGGAHTDVLEFGGPERARRAWPRWAAAAVAVAVLGLLAAHARRDAPTVPLPALPSTPEAPSSAAVTPGTAPTGPLVTRLGGPLLGVTAGWEVLGRSPTEVVRLELARGLVTRTPVPPLSSSGPVSFVAGRTWTIIRPLDFVPGYLVPDGRAARDLPGALAVSGPAFPGPDGRTAWVPVADGGSGMRLVGADGRPTGIVAPVPAGLEWSLRPDGTGHLMTSGTGGVYLVSPEGLRRLSTGSPLAVGPTRLLAVECDERHRCASVVVDRRTGARHVLDPDADEPQQPAGIISPDGTTAAMLTGDASFAGAGAVYLLDLATGARRALPLRVDQATDGTLAWSPDGRWLFVATTGGRLRAVQAATAQVSDLPPGLPPVTQVAVRPTS